MTLFRDDHELARARAVKMPFGKHAGATLGHVADADPLYLDWLVGQDIRSPKLRGAIEIVHASESERIEQALEDKEHR